jgi:N-acetylmuramoyl-L-alanine amidase
LYKVQVGVFSEKRNADRLVELLKEDGYEAIVISEAAFHRVQTGAFSSEANAARLAEELRGKGYEAIIVR